MTTLWQRWMVVGLGAIALGIGSNTRTIAQEDSGCGTPVLSRLTNHTIASGETIDSIAAKYDLLPTTLMGLNPVLQAGKAPVGTTIQVPPFNGVKVSVPSGQTWREVARRYKVRPDVVFEVNGCRTDPRVVFVPGVNWAPAGGSVATAKSPQQQPETVISGSPLPSAPTPNSVLLGYGWRLQPGTEKTAFHGGIDLAAAVGTSVLAAGDGVVAFAGTQGGFGNLVVINHAEGLQTRYAQLATISVKVGQSVKKGATVGTVGTTGTPSSEESHLHFEVRSRSNLGWVAQDPTLYVIKEVPRSTAGN